MDNAGKYRELREMHKEFIYHGYDIADDGIFFHFSIDDYHFYPSWKTESGLLKNVTPFLEYIIFNLGMAELVSYWKCACPPVVKVKCGSRRKAVPVVEKALLKRTGRVLLQK